MELHWSPTIGDPTPMGWFTVFAYLAAAMLSLLAALRSQPPRARAGSDRWFWLGVALLFVALAINKQLDLQSLLTAIGRALSQRQGWYEDRRLFQEIFIIAVLAVGSAILIALLWQARRRGRSVKLAIAGLGFTFAFVAMRSASFHHMDWLLGQQVGGIYWNWILELAGIATVALAAASYRPPRGGPARTRRRPRRHRAP